MVLIFFSRCHVFYPLFHLSGLPFSFFVNNLTFSLLSTFFITSLRFYSFRPCLYYIFPFSVVFCLFSTHFYLFCFFRLFHRFTPSFCHFFTLGSEYTDYNLIMATTFGMPINGSYIRDQMQKVIDKEGLPDVVFHSLRHTSVTYKLKLSGGDIKAVQGDSGHAQADMVTEVYGHIIDEDRRKNAEKMENAFYNKENLNPDIHEQKEEENKITIPEGVDPELLMKVLGNPEMAALLNSLAKTMKV